MSTSTPIVGGTYSLPKSALIPLFALWFGIGNVTAIAAVFLACLLPMIVNTYHGVVTTAEGSGLERGGAGNAANASCGRVSSFATRCPTSSPGSV